MTPVADGLHSRDFRTDVAGALIGWRRVGSDERRGLVYSKAVTYELWDLQTRNCVGTFVSRGEAFEAVRAIAREQPDMVKHLELAGEDTDGAQLLKATGQELADLAVTNAA